MNWWDQHEHIKKEEFSYYIASLSNLIIPLINTGQFDDVKVILDRIANLATHTPCEEALVFQSLTYFRLLYYLNITEFDAICQMAPTIEKILDKHSFPPKTTYGFISNMALAYFIWKIILNAYAG